METNAEMTLSVVAVMVVHEPGEWFEQTLDSIAGQDFPSLKTLFLVADDDPATADRIRARLPDAFVRNVVGNPGYGPAVNEVLRLVEGDNGFFLLMHDDVALEPNVVRALVEELYRSNAGIVGPKLVLWDDARVLQHVGLGVDRFGEIDPLVEPGEADQEQHDAVRDVFALPSACLLVRADLFRALGGFDESITYHGDDLDLCWRAHLGGARVVVAPAARVRHREQLRERRPDLAHRALEARHRVRTVATLTGGLRLPLVLAQMLVVSLAEMVVGLFTGRLGEAFASFRSTLGLAVRLPSIIARRRSVAGLRHVPYREVAGLQIRGSARLASYLRTREQHNTSIDHSSIGARRFTRNTAGQIAAWVSVILLAVLGSRQFILDGVPAVGEFLRFPSSTRTLLGDYWSGWWGHGLGRTTAAPTGIGILGVVGIASLGNMGLLHTLAVLAWLPIGYLGAWRLMSIFPSSRARIAGLVVYAAVPLPYTALGAGRWSVIAAYGATPWVVHLLRRIARIEPALTARADADVADDTAPRQVRDQLRHFAQLALLVAVVTAFAPTYAGIVAVIAITLAVTTVIARGSLLTSVLLAGGGVAAALLAVALNLPWISTLIGDHGWDAFVGAPTTMSRTPTSTDSLVDVLRFAVGPGPVGVLAVALWLPVIAGPLLARGWRLTWAARGGVLAGVGLLLGALGSRDALPFRLPELGLLLAPAAVGVAVAAACAMAAFEQDVQGGTFGWRQPLGVLCGLAVLVGAVPAVASAANGHWSTPSMSVLQQFEADPADGDSRTLIIGDTRVLPIAGWRLDDAGQSGVSYTIVDDGAPTIQQHWAGRPSDAEIEVRDILGLIARSSTSRAGRLLAPFAIRYVVIPLVDGVDSTTGSPIGPPAGLVAGLTSQLDFRRLYTPRSYIAFENVAWAPTQSTLSAAAADASRQAGFDALAWTAIEPSTPQFVGMPDRGPATGDVGVGVLHLAKPFDTRWSLRVDGQDVSARPAFGTTMAFDVEQAGAGSLVYTTDGARHAAVIVQTVAWVLVTLVASRVSLRRLRRRRRGTIADEGPLLRLGAPIEPELAVIGASDEDRS